MMLQKSAITISVDTNFINYARAVLQGKFNPAKVVYIPNFAWPPKNDAWTKKWESSDEIVFLFARRFTVYRGTLLWADVVSDLLRSGTKAKFIFDGEGRYEPELRERFKNMPQVKIRAIDPDKMAAEYEAAHVVVVPTLYSEGTSLTCLEGMGHGCIPLVTDVGGLMNLVLPDYNGIIARPIRAEMVAACKALLADWEHMRKLALNAQDIAATAFSVSKWRQRIATAIDKAGVFNR
jgi:glycosyltransferase involved in cell wall biosynthesis